MILKSYDNKNLGGHHGFIFIIIPEGAEGGADVEEEIVPEFHLSLESSFY